MTNQRRYRRCQRVKEDSEGFRQKCNQPTTRGRRYCFDCRVWYHKHGGATVSRRIAAGSCLR